MKKLNKKIFIIGLLFLLESIVIIYGNNITRNNIASPVTYKEVNISQIIYIIKDRKLGEINRISENSLGYLVEVESIVPTDEISSILTNKFSEFKINNYKITINSEESMINITIFYPKSIKTNI